MVITTYDLWMTHGLNDTFALTFNYINKKWKPCHTTMAIFEVHETTRATIISQLKDLLTWCDLLDKIIAYVKDENANMNTLTTTLTSIVFHSYFFNFMLAFVMAMPCLNAFSMWLITWFISMEWNRFHLKKFNFLCKR